MPYFWLPCFYLPPSPAAKPRRLHLFSYVLGYSRRQYLHFVERQNFDTTLRQHIAAFTHLGGVAASCLYDNFKVVVQGYEDDEPIYNPRFLAFATHYGFRQWACRPGRPQEVWTCGYRRQSLSLSSGCLINGRVVACSCWSRSAVLI